MDQNQPSTSQIAGQVSQEAKGFFGMLLDFSFENFVTPKIFKLVYCLMLIGVCIGALVFLGGNLLTGRASYILLGLVGTPIILVLGAVGARVYVEIVMIAFKMLETLQKIESKQR